MRRHETIFVVLDQVEVLASALRVYDGGQSSQVALAKTREETVAATADGPADIAVVRLRLYQGVLKAARFARKGFRLVVCVDSSPDREAELRALAPANFILKASTESDLVKALRAAFG